MLATPFFNNNWTTPIMIVPYPSYQFSISKDVQPNDWDDSKSTRAYVTLNYSPFPIHFCWKIDACFILPGPNQHTNCRLTNSNSAPMRCHQNLQLCNKKLCDDDLISYIKLRGTLVWVIISWIKLWAPWYDGITVLLEEREKLRSCCVRRKETRPISKHSINAMSLRQLRVRPPHLVDVCEELIIYRNSF